MYLRKRGIRSTIPRKDNERRRGPFDRQLYRLRNLVERLINRMKQFRRIATRYEKRAANYAAMVTVAAIYLWYSFHTHPNMIFPGLNRTSQAPFPAWEVIIPQIWHRPNMIQSLSPYHSHGEA